ncbi:MAG TPA: protein kinase [Terriglobales bacterium]|nr:protein kinase [Terriglobales bacterium]
MALHMVSQDAFVGQTLGHYRIAEKIGAGGMGEVFRAYDQHLDRYVAIKVLPPGTLSDETARKRFHKEALALSKLNHPNIATVHDFDTQRGVDFLVMEYIPGTNLSEQLGGRPLPEKDVISLGMQFAEGLSAAHEQGVIHRDVKPGNLRLTSDGRLKILDFGLARLRLPATATSPTESLSETQTISGTLPYMAPEQLLDGEIDARTDIHAVGSVLYEMATGQQPFAQVERSRLIGAILHRPPRPVRELNPGLSPGLERIIHKCLEKKPENRFQSARELAIELRRLQSDWLSAAPPVVRLAKWSSAQSVGLGLGILALVAVLVIAFHVGDWRERLFRRSSAPHIQSLAVLPLANLSADPQQEYFTDGMTEALIAELSQIGSLKVISRTSVMRFKDTSKPLPQIARELDVDGIVEGSVLRSGDRVRVTAQLIHALSDTHLWGKSYERDLRDVLTLQREVAQAIANEIRGKVTPQGQTRLAKARLVNPEAYELYLKGRYEWNKRTEEGLKRGLQYFQQAIDVDPTYPLAHSGLADCYDILGEHDLLPGNEVYPKAKAAALRALELDDASAEAHTSLGEVLFDYDRNPEAALKEFQTAIRLNPNYATAHHWYGMRLAMMGRGEEAFREMQQARHLDPLSYIINGNVAAVLYFARQYDRALVEARKTLELEPRWGPGFIPAIYIQKGMIKEAIAVIQKEQSIPGSISPTLLIRAYAADGNRKEALRVFTELRQQAQKGYISPFAMASACTSLGEREEALSWLQKGFDEYAGGMDKLKVDPDLDPLRSDPRFQELLRRMNFPP